MNVLLEVIALLAVAVFSNGLEEQKYKIDRRFMSLPSSSVIIGAPSYPSHLPEAEPVLPGHTLIRPALGMLKSAVKFPHRELEGSSGVYGGEDSLGLRFDGRNERVLYTGSRRRNTNKKSGIIVIIPNKNRDVKQSSVNEIESLGNIKDFLKTVMKDKRKPGDKQLFKQLSGSQMQRPPLIKTARRQPPPAKPTMPSRGLNDDLRPKTSEGPTRYTTHARGYSGVFHKDIPLDLKKRIIQSSSKKQKVKPDPIADRLIFPKKLPGWPNFMGHYRKNNDVLEKVMNILLRHTGKNKRRQQAVVGSKPQSQIHHFNEDSVEDENINLMKSVEATFDVESQTAMPRKQELFWKSKNLFTHIKIDQHAPEYRDFLPNDIEADDIDGIRNWWFYNQADHKEIVDED